MAFLSTSASLSGSAPGKSLIDPRKPLWQYQQTHCHILTKATRGQKRQNRGTNANVCHSVKYGVEFSVNILQHHHLQRTIYLNLLWNITEKNNKYFYWLYAVNCKWKTVGEIWSQSLNKTPNKSFTFTGGATGMVLPPGTPPPYPGMDGFGEGTWGYDGICAGAPP